MAKTTRTYPARTIGLGEQLTVVHQAERGVIDQTDAVAFAREQLAGATRPSLVQGHTMALAQAERTLLARIAERDALVAKYGTRDSLRAQLAAENAAAE